MYTFFGNRNEVLHTSIATAAGVTSTIATAGAVLVSFLDAQRSAKPSSLLELYYAAIVITYLPRLRSLWLSSSPDVDFLRNLWTSQYIVTILLAILESCGGKIHFLGSRESKGPREESLGFWARSLFVWILPTLRRGYSNTLDVPDLPTLDPLLGGKEAHIRLEEAWSECLLHYRLLRAIFVAYARDILICIPPRLVLGGFTFCQPFLIQAAIEISEQRASPPIKDYGRALVGAFVLVYLGMAVSSAKIRLPKDLNSY